jgi:hypothetical protein
LTQLTVTFFEDFTASAAMQKTLSVDDLAMLIRRTTAPAKASLPWLKLARFGNTRTPKGSLRHDRNVIAITGVEADYDGAVISIDEAVGIAEKAGLYAVVYASPSHRAAAPRWRLLCPTSREITAVERAQMMGRLAGLYRGIFAAESWTLSQAYYYGSVDHNPDHRVELVDGEPIDTLHELDQIAIGRPGTKAPGNGADTSSTGPADEAALIEQIVTGASYHTAAIRLLGLWAHQGVAMIAAEQRLRAIFGGVFPPDRDERWQSRVDEIPRLLEHVWGKEAEKSAQTTANDGADDAGVALSDFHAYMPQHLYIFTPAREMWPGVSVNARIQPIPDGVDRDGRPKTMTASCWLDRNQPVEQMTWAPGLPMIIKDRLISGGGWIERGGVSCFNLYRPPNVHLGDPAQAGPWLEHVRRIYPDDSEHIIRWLAHRVQRPQDKINHALLLGGNHGIGKDTLLEAVKPAIGAWNFAEISPQQAVGRFNGFLKSVILRLNEACDLGDTDRFQFYDHLKAITAAPPDVLRVDEKHLREYTVLNCTGVIITTNHKTDGIYLPADDRRHYVAWSDLKKEDFEDIYWSDLWGWYAELGGYEHVAAHLTTLDLADFNPKAPPKKTSAFWEIVDASRNPVDAELADAIDELGRPDIVTISQIATSAPARFSDWLRDRKNSRVIPHRLEECGYVAVRNPGAQDGLWKVSGKRQVIYAKSDLPIRDRFDLAQKHAGVR